MTQPLPTAHMPDPSEFTESFIAARQPVVVTGLDYDPQSWTPAAVSEKVGDLTAMVYGDLFDLEDVHTADMYFEDYFGATDPDDEVPYIRWYNKLRNVDFAWGDTAFERLSTTWRAPSCLPTNDYRVPDQANPNPVTDPFPYRGIQIAARGSRTRLHRDPFASDAVVCQFFGRKEAILYRPERAGELSESIDGTSFGGFRDVRPNGGPVEVEPDYYGVLDPGDMIYIPRGWLHDVLVLEDSLSITWNFVHRSGGAEHDAYLQSQPEADTEYEILEYFRSLASATD